MVLTRPFQCPTRVIQGQPFDEVLRELVGERRWSLVTSTGWLKRGAVEALRDRCGSPAGVFTDVDSNPTVATVVALAESLPDVDVVVAVGGGSVIDAAKGALALKALAGAIVPFMAHLRGGVPLPDALAPTPLIAVPTTSGTGSEVTCWGTIWGEDRIKHSVSHDGLFPSHAVLDPALCLSMPGALTVATGLDALSHAMESVWNRRHTDHSDALAEQAIRRLRLDLGEALARPGEIEVRRRVQTASLLAGLAMGTTQTAAAHSISYPFTAHFGVPHGLACSFTLAEVTRYNMETDPGRIAPIAAGLGCAVEDIPGHLESWFDGLGFGRLLGRYVTPDVADTIDGNLITRARAANNIRDVDEASARRIARRALLRFCPAGVQRAAPGS